MKMSPKERMIVKQADRLCRAIDRSFASDKCPFDMELARDLEVARAAAGHLRWTYPVDYEYQFIEPENRISSMLSGPFFTSTDHPWPVDAKGTPLEPICQIDLTLPSEISGLALGDGLLQVWMDGVEGRLRCILERDAQVDKLTDVPQAAKDHIWPLAKGRSLFEQTDLWTHGYLMTGIYEPVITIPSGLTVDLDRLPCDIPNKPIVSAIAALNDALAEDIESRSTGSICFFGNFDSIQYREIDCPEALLLMESGDIFLWGDCGNAQVFYEPKKSGEIEFSFEWSCP